MDFFKSNLLISKGEIEKKNISNQLKSLLLVGILPSSLEHKASSSSKSLVCWTKNVKLSWYDNFLDSCSSTTCGEMVIYIIKSDAIRFLKVTPSHGHHICADKINLLLQKTF